MTNLPVKYDFMTHYRGDGLRPFQFRFIQDGEPIDLSLSSAIMQMRQPTLNRRGKVMWEFDSASTDPNKKLTLTADGLLIFPEMNDWEIPANSYMYDLQITDGNGFVKTFIQGEWKVNQDITV